MFDAIILLTETVEAGPLSAALLRHNPHLTLRAAETLNDLNAIEPRLLRGARLISFASTVVVPGPILKRLGYGAYNFHPGPPNYPGWAPAQFAIYDRAASFGVTVHVMHERVDSGPIVAVDLFDVPAAATPEGLETLAYTRLARNFFALAEALATSPRALPPLPVQWCGRKSTQRRCAELCEIPLDIAPDELARRVAAFGDGRLGVAPTMALHGNRFRLVGAELTVVAELPRSTADQPPATAVPA
ncbi:MAG: formyltransferase family protein [Pseudolabrys sp.]